MNLKDHQSKFQTRANESILLGYSLNSVFCQVMNRRKRKIEEMFTLIFVDHYTKKVEYLLSLSSTFPKNLVDFDPLLTLDIEFNLIFDESAREISLKRNALDNHVCEASKHYDESTISSENSSLIFEGTLLILRIHISRGSQMFQCQMYRLRGSIEYTD